MQYLNLPEFWDLLTTTKVTVDISTDRRQLNRQEVAWIFRCCLGSRPVKRGLSFPQFLDAVSRASLILAFRDRRINELEAGLESVGVFTEGGATDEILSGDNDWDDSSDSDDYVDPNSTTVGGVMQDDEERPTSAGEGEHQPRQESLHRHHFDTDNVSARALGRYLTHYFVRRFERFVKVVSN